MRLPEEIIIEILHLLPSKSLARFKCVCKSWARYICDSSVSYSCRSRRWKPRPPLIGFFYHNPCEADYPIRFFFSDKGSSQPDNESFDKSVSFLPDRIYVIASSNGFLLCSQSLHYQRGYYVCNPATRQWLALPNAKVFVRDVAVGFVCKVDDPSEDVNSFTVVRILIPCKYVGLQSTVKIESFSSQTKAWTEFTLALDIPIRIYYGKTPELLTAAGVIEGVFYWLYRDTDYAFESLHINVYDSVERCFWSLDLPQPESALPERNRYHVGVSDGILCYAMSDHSDVMVWHLEGSFRSRDARWVMKYDVYVGYIVNGGAMQFVGFHPADPHIIYLTGFRRIICYNLEKDRAESVDQFGSGGRYQFFPYEWQEWPRLL